MHSNDDKVIDPVCGMRVDPSQLTVEYMQMHFAFCSEQCRERFLANPGLYVGIPGHKSVRQMGDELIRRRRLQLAEPLPPASADALKNKLHSMMGIKNVECFGTRWEISYDLLQATAEQIERAMMEFGAGLGGNWAEKLRRAFVHYVEEYELSSIEVPEGPHSHHH